MTTRGSMRWWALGAVSLAVLAVGLDGTVLTVALPTLAKTLHASESDLQWFTSGYFLVLAAAMLPAGLLGDRYGHKRSSRSVSRSSAWDRSRAPTRRPPVQFLAARVVLGLAGAAVIVMAISALTVLFTPEERPKAVGIWAAATFLSLPIGPIFGGWVLTNFWWGWVFLVNAPVAAVGLIAVIALVPESRPSDRPSVDVVGVGVSAAGLVALTYGLIEAGQHGWSNPVALLAMAGGVVLLAAFAAWERHLAHLPGSRPLLDVTLFRSASFTWGVILAAVAILSMIGVLFTMPQYFQGVLGADAMGSGLRLLPLIGGLIVGAVPADRVVRALGAKVVAAGGFALLAIGLLLGSTTVVASSTAFVAGWMAVVGLGMGLAMATTASAALVELSEERSGVGSAVLQAANKVGGPFGTAVLGSVLSSVYLARLVLTGLPAAAADTVKQSVFAGVAVAQHIGSPALLASVRTAFTDGMDTALIVSSGIAIAGLVLTVLFLPRRNVAEAPLPQAMIEEADLVTSS